jgi:hypothetical protein
MKFSIENNNYGVDRFGVIKHLNPMPYKYDEKYVAIYDSPDYKKNSDYLQALRLGFVFGAHGGPIQTISDIGYGTGAFMREAKKTIPHVFGVDLTGVQIEDCYIMPYIVKSDVACMWDALEHFHNLDFVADLPVETIVLSLPYCHFHTEGKEWMANSYLHLKPSEHIFHFNELSLGAMMRYYGWQTVAISGHEDIVRKSKHGLQNILSMAFKRK